MPMLTILEYTLVLVHKLHGLKNKFLQVLSLMMMTTPGGEEVMTTTGQEVVMTTTGVEVGA